MLGAVVLGSHSLAQLFNASCCPWRVRFGLSWPVPLPAVLPHESAGSHGLKPDWLGGRGVSLRASLDREGTNRLWVNEQMPGMLGSRRASCRHLASSRQGPRRLTEMTWKLGC